MVLGRWLEYKHEPVLNLYPSFENSCRVARDRIQSNQYPITEDNINNNYSFIIPADSNKTSKSGIRTFVSLQMLAKII